MSMAFCKDCGNLVDTKSGRGLEGSWIVSDYICPDCTELREAYKEACRLEAERDRAEYLMEEKATQVREDQRYSK